MSVLEAYVTNLGKYNEGELTGEYLKLPAEKSDLQELFKRIGVDGIRYEEYFITHYETEIEGLHDCLSEYESLDELNYLASLLEDMDEGKREKFGAAIVYGDSTKSVEALINLAQNLDCYEYYPVISEEELGLYLINDLDIMTIPEPIQPYFDYEAYGRDVSIDEGGAFTSYGYIASNGNIFTEHYDGRDIPEEYKIFAYPEREKSSILEALRNSPQTHDAAPARREKNKPSHEER